MELTIESALVMEGSREPGWLPVLFTLSRDGVRVGGMGHIVLLSVDPDARRWVLKQYDHYCDDPLLDGSGEDNKVRVLGIKELCEGKAFTESDLTYAIDRWLEACGYSPVINKKQSQFVTFEEWERLHPLPIR